MRVGRVLLGVLVGVASCAPTAGAASVIGPDGCQVPPEFDVASGTLSIDSSGTSVVSLELDPAADGVRLTIRTTAVPACPGSSTYGSFTSQTTAHSMSGVRRLRVRASLMSIPSWSTIAARLEPDLVIEPVDMTLRVSQWAASPTPIRITALDATTIDLDGDASADLRFPEGGRLEAQGSNQGDIVDLRLLDPDVHSDMNLRDGVDSWFAPLDAAAPDEDHGCAHGVDLGSGDDVAIGGAGSDCITGGRGSDELRGAAGDDDIHGTDSRTPSGFNGRTPPSTDRDRIEGGAGNDHIVGGDGPDIIIGGVGDDTIQGFHGNDVVSGGAGDDNLEGNSGADTVLGGDGMDLTDGDQLGALAPDRLFGGAGNDRVRGYGGGDRAFGGPGHDLMELYRDTIGRGGPGDDWMNHTWGVALMYGEVGNDVLVSGVRVRRGLLSGGPGRDVLAIEHVRNEAWLRTIQVDCGAGDDRVWTKAIRLRSCERLWECMDVFGKPLGTCGSLPWGEPNRDPTVWVRQPPGVCLPNRLCD